MVFGYPLRPLSALRRYTISVASVGAAVLLTASIPALHASTSALFVLAVLLSSWYGGPGPAALAAALSLFSVDFFFIPPYRVLQIDAEHIARAATFGIILAFVVWFTEIRRRLERNLMEHTARLNEQARVLARTESELKQMDRRKDEFLAVLAHELRNPLGALRSGLYVLRDPLYSEQARVNEMIDRQMGKLVRLVDDLLDVTRISSGKVRLRRERVDLAALVHEVVESNRSAIEACSHHLTVRLPSGPVFLLGDRVRLAQVLSNLVENAIKFTPHGGHITLEGEATIGWMTLRLRDNGIGIPEEMLPRLFEMFTQGIGSGERSQGLGIGLNLVRKLVLLHSGSIEARSDGPGRGTEFVLRLPMAETSREPSHGAIQRVTAVHGDSCGRRVLVVDDDTDSADAMSLVLKRMGHETRTASDGEQAIETASLFLPEFALVDIGLPSMSGYEVAQRMRKDPTHHELVLIAVTGWGQETDRLRSQEAGFDHHFVKPVDPSQLQSLFAASEPAALRDR